MKIGFEKIFNKYLKIIYVTIFFSNISLLKLKFGQFKNKIKSKSLLKKFSFFKTKRNQS